MLKQGLYQKQLQKLSPLQIQTIKLLELPLMQLEQRIKKELEENPVLEEEANVENESQEEVDDTANDDEFSLEDYMEEDDIPSYKLSANNTSKDDKYTEYGTLTGRMSLQQSLEEQIMFQYLSEKQKGIAFFLIGSIDDDGYLRRDLGSISDDLAFRSNIEVSVDELETVLKVIQKLEPYGVGARDLRECLLIQLDAKTKKSDALELAKKVIDLCYEEFVKKHYERILSKLKTNDDNLRDALDEIIKLNPKPGSDFESMYSEAQPITPDFLLEQKNGELNLSLNNYNIPSLRINKNYFDIVTSNANKNTQESKDATKFIKSKVESAKWFIDAIEQRQHTLLTTTRAIISYQENYFITGNQSELRPMILKNIAEITGFDISTISRVVNSKYIETDWGIFLLKDFFSEGMQSESGEEVSTKEIKRILAECVDNEDKSKPYTDEALTQILKEKGYPIARRTVAKYREQLEIPVGRLRRIL